MKGLYKVSQDKGPAFEKMLLPEYQSNGIENYLVLFPVSSALFSNLTGLNWPFLPFEFEVGDFLWKAAFGNVQKHVKNNKQDFRWLSFLAIMTSGYYLVFPPLTKMESL